MTSSGDLDVGSQLQKLIRSVPGFPHEPIIFRDITPLLADPHGLGQAVYALAQPFENQKIDLVVGAESRGFIFGATVATHLSCGFVPIRKLGKLPCPTIRQEYQLEYGTDILEIHADAIKPDQRVLLVDDLLATGGTMFACCQMVEKLGGKIVGISFLIELAFLHGRNKLQPYPIHSVISYQTE